MITIKTLATGSKGNCYVVDDGSTTLLLECGISFKEIQRALDFNTRDIAGCLVTHDHGDHIRGLEGVLKASIDVYMSPGTAEAIGIEHHRLHSVKCKEQFAIGTWTVLPFDTEHDVAEPFGFLLQSDNGERLLFITDSFYCRYKFPGINYLMIECNYSLEILDRNIAAGITPKVMKKRLMKSHFSLENVLTFLKANDLSKVEEIWLLHLSDSNSDEELFRQKVAEATGKLIYIP